MPTYRRAVAFVLATIFLLLGISLITAVFLLPGPYSVSAYDGEQFSFSPLSVTDKVIGSGGGLLLLLAGVIVLALELLGPPRRQHLPIASVSVAQTSIERHSVETRLAAVLESLPGVSAAVPRVQLEGDSAAVDAGLVLAPGVAVPALCEQAEALIRETLEHELGLHPGHLRLRLRHTPGADKDSAPAPA